MPSFLVLAAAAGPLAPRESPRTLPYRFRDFRLTDAADRVVEKHHA